MNRYYDTLASAYYGLKDFEKALDAINKCMERRPQLWTNHKRRGAILFGLHRYAEALDDLRESLKLRPADTSTLIWIPPSLVARCPDESFREGLLKLADSAVEKNPGARGRRSQLCLGLGIWDKARADLEERTSSDAPGHYDYYQYALVCLAQNDLPKYRELCARMVQQYAQTDDASAANFVAWTCALHPAAIDDFEPAIELAKAAVEKDGENVQFQGTLGAILYRAARHEEARDRLSALAKQLEEPDSKADSSPAYCWYFLAMAHKAAGQDQEAREYLAKANAWTDKVLADEENPPPWNRRETLKLLREEAEGLIEGANQETGEGAPEPENEPENDEKSDQPASG